MKKKFFLVAAALLAAAFTARSQVDLDAEFFSLPEEVTNSYLDSMTIQSVKPNDYWMVGGYGGAALLFGYFNPTRSTRLFPNYPLYGVSVVRYFKMFGIFANMGAEFGFQHNIEGYEFKTNETTGYRSTESGAYKAVMEVPEVFLLSHFHFDMGEYVKLIAKAGLYGGYRMNIHRTLDSPYDTYESYQAFVDTFQDYDRRYSYGVQAGLGMALMVNPFELHLMVQGKWSWSSYWQPDYASEYYYRFGYPMDLGVTAGLYYQLTPRHGHTRAQLRKLARKMVEENASHEN